MDLADLARDRLHALGVGAVGEVAHQRLPRQLEQDAPEGGLAHAPTWNLAKRRITTFSPVVPDSSARSCSIVLLVVLVDVDVRLVQEDDLLHPLAQLALGDLRPHVLGLVGGLLLEHAQLGVLVGLRDLVLVDVAHAGRAGDVEGDVARERDEVVVAGDEVGVAVDLDEHAGLAVRVDVGLHGALGGLAAAHLEGLVAEADAQQLDGGVDVAAGLGQRRLAIHHPGARLVAQLLDLRAVIVGGAHAFSVFFSRRSSSRRRPWRPSWRAACGPASWASRSPRRAAGWPPPARTRRARPARRRPGRPRRPRRRRCPRPSGPRPRRPAATSASAAALSPAGGRRRPAPERPRRRARRARPRRGSARPRRGLGRGRSGGLRGRSGVTLGLARGGLLGLLALALLLLAGGALLGLLAGLLLGLLAGALLLGPERREALGDDVADRLRDDRAGLDRVVVARDHVVDPVRVAVRVDEADDRDPQALGLLDRDDLGLEVDDEHRVGRALHVLDAAEVGLELREVGLGRHALARRQQRRAGPRTRSARGRAGA